MTATPRVPPTPKKPYTAPRLTTHGKLKDIVQGGGGTKNEPGGGNPNTRR
jgi:hypothetical protein